MTAEKAPLLTALIRRECETALRVVDGVDREDFLADDLLQHAVAMSLVAIGEYAARLAQASPDLVTKRPDIPWTAIIGMRNRIAHGYHGLDFEVVWDTLKTSLPDLLAKLAAQP